jgi:hypothetical protein
LKKNTSGKLQNRVLLNAFIKKVAWCGEKTWQRVDVLL